ncbi:hypothetical protein GCM10010294_36030 [Streptomyces griseoloalbus]|uniref:cellulose binding domain-containing protein n=1 Tax=Streptomyces griseoloalbus TaxID=67303 RepID=UPI0018761F23|nr:hypothetical protein GCM10010294_36030 [Streptomyces griseoloalbus]
MSRTPFSHRPAITAAPSAVVLSLTGLTGAAPPPEPPSTAAAPDQDPSLPVADRVEDLLSRMSLDDKTGQPTQIEKDAPVPQSDVGLTYDTAPDPDPDPDSTPTACTARFRVTSSWSGGHQAEVTVENTGAEPLTGWSVERPLEGTAVTNYRNSSPSVTRDGATVRNTAHNGTLAPHATPS